MLQLVSLCVAICQLLIGPTPLCCCNNTSTESGFTRLLRSPARPVSVALVHSPRRSEPGKIKGGHLVQAARELGAKPVPSAGSRPGESPLATGQALSEAEGAIGKGDQQDDRLAE